MTGKFCQTDKGYFFYRLPTDTHAAGSLAQTFLHRNENVFLFQTASPSVIAWRTFRLDRALRGMRTPIVMAS